MGIYSKDRTMLTIDPEAKSTPISGYTSAKDLYKIMEETLSIELESFRDILDSESSMLYLEESDAAKISKRAKSLDKLCTSTKAQLANASAKVKSVCAGINKKASAFAEKNDVIDKYSVKFEGNKDIMVTSHFKMKYNKSALECTDKEIAKFVKEAANAGKALAKSASSIAKSNAEEINKNKHNIFNVSSMAKYANKFCCCEDKNIVAENPFKGSIKPGTLVAEIKGASKVNFEGAISAMDESFADLSKQITKIQESAAKSTDISEKDMASVYAISAIAEGLIKAYIHMINDAYKCYTAHVKECVKVYIAASNIKGVKENGEVVYRTTAVALSEAEVFAHKFDLFLESDEEELKDNGENDPSLETSDGDAKTEGCKSESCKKEACKEAEESVDDSKDDKTEDPAEEESPKECGINCSAIFNGKSLIEAVSDARLIYATNSIAGFEAIAEAEYDAYCENVANGMIDSDALAAASAQTECELKNKTIADILTAKSAIVALKDKLCEDIRNNITANAFMYDDQANDRMIAGSETLGAKETACEYVLLNSQYDEAMLKLIEATQSAITKIMTDEIIDPEQLRYEIRTMIVPSKSDNPTELFAVNRSEIINRETMDNASKSIISFRDNTNGSFETVVLRALGVLDETSKLVAAGPCDPDRLQLVSDAVGYMLISITAFFNAVFADYTSKTEILLKCWNAAKK